MADPTPEERARAIVQPLSLDSEQMRVAVTNRIAAAIRSAEAAARAAERERCAGVLRDRIERLPPPHDLTEYGHGAKDALDGMLAAIRETDHA